MRKDRSTTGLRPFALDGAANLLCLSAILGAMRIDRILIVLGATLLVLAVVLVGRSWFANVLDTVPSEVTEPVAILIAGVIALVSLTAAAYLTLEEWKEAKHRRSKTNEERRS